MSSKKPNTMTQDELIAMFPDAALTIRDRLNFPFLIAAQIMTFQRAILNLEFSAEEIREAVEGLVHLLPNKWKDDIFADELRKARIDLTEDVRPTFCGHPASIEYCKKHNILITRIIRTFDYYEVFQACMNLLDRRGLLSRRIYKEIMTGRKADTSLSEFEEDESAFSS